jgi:manganese/zinc/iron transport system ATP- binding protein
MKIATEDPILQVYNLTVHYSNTIVLSDVTISITSGCMVGIIGPNGAGKSTLLQAIVGLIPYTSGKIYIAGKKPSEARNAFAYIAQRSSVDWDFPITVYDMVLMGCYGQLGWFRRPGKQEYERVYEALRLVGLEAMACSPIGNLSGGQQQRAFIARALMQKPSMYILDEPFAGVDAVSEEIIMRLFQQLRNEGKTVIIVHHDLVTAPRYFDSVVLLNKACIAQGPIELVLHEDNLNLLYGRAYSMHQQVKSSSFNNKIQFDI